ncbi:MAG TPA: glycosyltransferase [Actinomycetota bacterium]|nr:glycosyltransferase [Actinomycetota bacterium]HNL51367.1 glycosyltransferase [Actinomycetota bacterium]HNO15851.1 glycosyltransferase [Actinomycetota bacterium]HUM87034.1 glycosyltransferase [Actinomycetota bacterium]
MRIVHVIAEFSAHEAMGRTVTEIAKRVPGEHVVITTTAHDGQDVFAEVVELGGAVETFPLGRREALDSALARLTPDLVHVHGGALVPLLIARTAIPWYPNLLTMYAWPVLPSLRRLRSGGIRAAMQSNVLRPRVLASSVLPTWLVKRSLRRSGTREVLTPDPRVERKLGALRVGSGGPQDSRRATFTDEAPVVLFAGRAESVRGIDTLLACFPDVVREVPDARLRLLLIPRPELEALLETARAAGLGDHLDVVTEPVSDLLGEMAAAQVGTWPFKYDYTTSPPAMAAAEALSVGLPTVGTEVSCVEAVIEDGVNGDLVPPADPKALAAALVRLLKDRDTWDRYATAGPESVTRRLSWEGMGRAVAQAYAEVVGSEVDTRQAV